MFSIPVDLIYIYSELVFHPTVDNIELRVLTLASNAFYWAERRRLEFTRKEVRGRDAYSDSVRRDQKKGRAFAFRVLEVSSALSHSQPPIQETFGTGKMFVASQLSD